MARASRAGSLVSWTINASLTRFGAGLLPTGEQFRHLARVYSAEEGRLRDAGAAIEAVGEHPVFDGVMHTTFVEFSARTAAEACRSSASGCANLATECMRRAAVAEAWAGHYRSYEHALRSWRVNVERSGVGVRPQPPERPAPWVDR